MVVSPLTQKIRYPSGSAAFVSAVQKSKAGFSLVEIMIAMVLGLLVMQGIIILFTQTERIFSHQSAMASLQESGRIALEIIGSDVRKVGNLPCGATSSPLVFANRLSGHIVGAPSQADAPAAAAANKPYPMDRAVFLEGSQCPDATCSPQPASGLSVPSSGLSDGKRVPGTDVLTVRYLDGTGWSVDRSTSTPACLAEAPLEHFSITKIPGDTLPSAFTPGHVGLLASCMDSRVIALNVSGRAVQPQTQGLGAPTCVREDGNLRLFDLDSELQTVSYYLQLKSSDQGRKVPVLMRRVNGVVGEVVEGVERLDFRYSLKDQAGSAYWLTAAEVAQGKASGTSLVCVGAGGTPRPCSWSDVSAIDISLLLNTVNDLPASPDKSVWNYRYTLDQDDVQQPGSTMPVTNLPAGRMLRREFRTVVALRNRVQ